MTLRVVRVAVSRIQNVGNCTSVDPCHSWVMGTGRGTVRVGGGNMGGGGCIICFASVNIKIL